MDKPRNKSMKTKEKGNGSNSSKKHVSAYKRAEQNLARIQQERKQKANERKKAIEEKTRRFEQNMSFRKRTNKVLKQRTKKGQPKLDAQIELLLEKIQRRVNK